MGRFQHNLSIGWLHPKSTHDHSLPWSNKKLTRKAITLSIQPTFDSPIPIPAQKVFPHLYLCLCRTEPINKRGITNTLVLSRDKMLCIYLLSPHSLNTKKIHSNLNSLNTSPKKPVH
jgi:hypothetical protein